ncbi:S-layer homology domain-containing protein [Paenibacillus sp. GP183]|uniref:S-layer homology domain-containing protein n=1 Tax=Paenibacillus sp. GP183 TaxID=1882751 RepID=UPI00089AAA01|nr:S-layer homology domain-containing protein [Paenibacillus sp. GP183]SEC17719.1 NPCBM/NEW2 domain-containing protein [Paenibacillus sp. GP183]
MSGLRKYAQVILILVLTISLVLPIAPTKVRADNRDNHSIAFNDIKNHWAQASIERLIDSQIVNGFEDGTFRSEGTVTREQFVKMLVQSQKYPLIDDTSPFSDVDKSRWSNTYILTAIKNGIIIPTEYGATFKPEEEISREEMAKMAARSLKLSDNEGALNFNDNDGIKNNRGLVGATVKAGIINGFPDGSFKPNDTATRAQAVVIITRVLDSKSKDITKENANNSVTLMPGVVTVDQSTVKQITNVAQDGSSIAFQGSPDAITNLKAGDIFTVVPSKDSALSIDYPFGFAKKVVSISNMGTQTVVQTSNPDFSEVVKDINIHSEDRVTSDQFIPADGVSIGKLADSSNPKEVVRILSADNELKPITFNKTIKGKGKNEIKLDGEIVFENPKVKSDISLSSNRMMVDFIAEAHGSINLTGNLELKDEPKPLPLGTFIVPVGTTGLGVKFELDLIVKMDGSADLTIKSTEKLTMEAGFKLDSDGLKPIGDFSLKPELKPVEFKGKFEGSVALAPNIYLSFLTFSLAGIENNFGLKFTIEGTYSLDSSAFAQSGGTQGSKGCLSMKDSFFIESNAAIKQIIKKEINLYKYENVFAQMNRCADVESIEVHPNELFLKPGGSEQLSVIGTMADNNALSNKLHRALTSDLQYQSEDKKLAIVDKNGLVSVPLNATPGSKTTITVSYHDKSASVTLVVQDINSQNQSNAPTKNTDPIPANNLTTDTLVRLEDLPIANQSLISDSGIRGSGVITPFHQAVSDTTGKYVFNGGILSGNFLDKNKPGFGENSGNNWVEYKIDGNFTEFTGTLFNPKLGYTGRAGRNLVRISGDGNLLYSYDEFNGLSAPVNFNVNIKGVKVLRMEFPFSPTDYSYSPWGIGNSYLKVVTKKPQSVFTSTNKRELELVGELNDTIHNAYPIESGTKYNAILQNADDVDWYKISTQKDGKVRIVLSNVPYQISGWLYDENEKVLTGMVPLTKDSWYNELELKKGKYYWRVSPLNWGESRSEGKYTISASFSMDE